MTDDQRERAIHACGQLMEQAMARYQRTYSGDDRAEAERYRAEMEALIAGRSPRQIRRMEAERGLAHA